MKRIRLSLPKTLAAPASCFVAFLLVLLSQAVQAADYYVSPTGRDTNPGTKTAPWQTLDKVNGFDFKPGDKILLEGGKVFTGYLRFTESGTASKVITLSSYGTGRATIQSGDSTAVMVISASHFYVSNLVCVGSGAAVNQENGINFKNEFLRNTRLANISIDNCEASGYFRGVLVQTAAVDESNSGFDGVRITRVSAHDNGEGGILVYGTLAHTAVYIGHCKAYDNHGVRTITDTHTGNGIIAAGIDGGTVEYCLAYNNGRDNGWKGGGPVGIWTAHSNNLTIQYCESYGNKTGTGKDGGGFDLDGAVTNSKIQYCYSHDNDGAGYLLYQYGGAPFGHRHNVVRFNISENDGRRNGYGGIEVGAVSDLEVYHNTVYMSPSRSGSPKAFSVGHGSLSRVNVRNNIFVTTGSVEAIYNSGSNNIRFEGNAYYNPDGLKIRWLSTKYNNLSDWVSATGQEKLADGTLTGTEENPRLKNPGKGIVFNDPSAIHTLTGYTLLPESPIAGKALDLRTRFGLNTGGTDYFHSSLAGQNRHTAGIHQPQENQSAPNLLSVPANPLQAHTNLGIYPNPAQKSATVWVSVPQPSVGHLTLTDAKGKVVYKAVQALQQGENVIPLSLADYASGVYVLQVTEGGKPYFKKVVIQ